MHSGGFTSDTALAEDQSTALIAVLFDFNTSKGRSIGYQLAIYQSFKGIRNC